MLLISVIASLFSAFLLAFRVYGFRGMKLVTGFILSYISAFVITKELVDQSDIFLNLSSDASWSIIVKIAFAIIPILALFPIKRESEKTFKTVALCSLFNLFVHMLNNEYSGISALVNICFILVVVSVTQDHQYERIHDINENLLKAQARYYEDINESNLKIRKIKHDMKNHLIAIEELNKIGDQKKTDEYIKSLREKIEESDIVYRTGNDIADAIINEKIKTAKKQGMELLVEGDLMGLNIDPVDTCTILSNLLDNAIEATAKLYGKVEEKKINLSFQKTNNFLIINQTNLTVNNGIEKTTKNGPNHGFGIQNIKDAVKRNDGDITITITPKENNLNQFEAEVMLPLN